MKITIVALGFAMSIIVLSMGTGCRQDTVKRITSNELVIGMSTAPKSLDPRFATDVSSARVQQLIYSSLVKLDQNSEIVSDLAENWEIPDPTIYRFHLKKDVFFHNGKRLTAKDVAATFRAILNPEISSPKRGAFEQIKEIRVIDDFTIEFETKALFAPFLITMVQSILPEEMTGMINPSDFIPIGTGPFLFKTRRGDDWISLEANPGYFEGVPKLNRVHFKTIPDDSVRLWELERGDIDFLQNNIPPDTMDWLKNNPTLKVMTSPGTSYYYIGLNFRSGMMTENLAVRRALAASLNRDEIIRYLLDGEAVAAESVLPASHWAANKELESITYDPDQAAQLLEKAGFHLDDNGIRLSIEFKSSQNKMSLRIAEVIQSQWAKAGIQTHIKSLEFGTFYDDIIKGNFQTFLLSWVGITDPDILFSLFHSNSVPPSGRNRGFYRNPAMDSLLIDARSQLDPETRIALYRQIQTMTHEDMPYINLWHTNNVAVMNKDLDGYDIYPAGDFTSFQKVSWRR